MLIILSLDILTVTASNVCTSPHIPSVEAYGLFRRCSNYYALCSVVLRKVLYHYLIGVSYRDNMCKSQNNSNHYFLTCNGAAFSRTSVRQRSSVGH